MSGTTTFSCFGFFWNVDWLAWWALLGAMPWVLFIDALERPSTAGEGWKVLW